MASLLIAGTSKRKLAWRPPRGSDSNLPTSARASAAFCRQDFAHL